MQKLAKSETKKFLSKKFPKGYSLQKVLAKKVFVSNLSEIFRDELLWYKDQIISS